MKYLFITYQACSRRYGEAFKTWSLTQGIYSLVGKEKKVVTIQEITETMQGTSQGNT